MKAKTKIILSSAALAAALAVTATSTFAWFATSTTPTINGWDMNVQAKTPNVTIAVAKDLDSAKTLAVQNFVGTITKDTIMAALKVGDSIPTLGAVNLDNKTAGKFVKQDGTTVVNANAAGSYLSFVIAFKADAQMDLVFDDTNAVLKRAEGDTGGTPIKAWKALGTTEYGVTTPLAIGDDVAADVSNAARVGFAVADTGLTGFEDDYKVWDPNSDAGFSKGTRNLAWDYVSYINGQAESNPAKTPVTGETAWTDALVEKAAFAQKTGASDADKVSYYAYLQVNVWLEGWDADCFDSILSQKLTVGLAFNVKTEI